MQNGLHREFDDGPQVEGCVKLRGILVVSSGSWERTLILQFSFLFPLSFLPGLSRRYFLILVSVNSKFYVSQPALKTKLERCLELRCLLPIDNNEKLVYVLFSLKQ